jgi:hypothetical protein
MRQVLMYAVVEPIPAEARLILSRALETVIPVGNRPKSDAAPQVWSQIILGVAWRPDLFSNYFGYS